MKNITLLFAALLTVTLSYGQEADSTKTLTVDEIAQQISNPTLPMFNFAMFYEYQGMTGTLADADGQSVNMFALQPPLPFPMKNGKNLLVRPLFPILFSQPVYGINGFESAGAAHLGDMAMDVLYAGTNANGIMKGVGLIGNVPLSTSPDIRGEWAVGPSLLLGAIKPYGVFVLVLNQSFDISGENKTSRLGGQYVFAFSLKGGWQLVSSPPFSYNWDTKALTFPVGGGPFKTIIVGKTPLKVGVQAYYFAAQADNFGPDWSIRLSITPSLKRPW